MQKEKTSEENISVVETTFQDMGIRARKHVAQHILLENTYESNLVSDISEVDYLRGHDGYTHLLPLSGLPTFVDNLYVFGYLEKKDLVCAKGKVLDSSGEDGSSKVVIS